MLAAKGLVLGAEAGDLVVGHSSGGSLRHALAQARSSGQTVARRRAG